MGTAFNPAKTSPASWDAFSDVDASVDAVLVELATMAADDTRPTRGLFGQCARAKLPVRLPAGEIGAGSPAGGRHTAL